MNEAARPDPLSQDLTCLRCLRPTPLKELDSQLWCEECLARARRRATVRGWAAGGALVLVLALYIGLWIRPDYSLIPTGWVLVLAVAFYLGGRVARARVLVWVGEDAEPACRGGLPAERRVRRSGRGRAGLGVGFHHPDSTPSVRPRISESVHGILAQEQADQLCGIGPLDWLELLYPARKAVGDEQVSLLIRGQSM